MALPFDYDLVPVRGSYVYLNGTPVNGQLKFKGKVLAVSTATDTIILPTELTAALVDGQFLVMLPATDDPNITPNGWTYTVEEKFPGGRTFDIEVPISAKATGVDLSKIAPAPPSGGGPTAFVTLTAFQTAQDNSEEARADAAQARADAATAMTASAEAKTVAADAVAAVGIERMPVSSGLSWTGAVDLTTLAATARTIRATLTGNTTLTLPTPPSSVSYTVTLMLTQDATGGRTLTLPAACLSAYGLDPVLSTAGGAVDLLHLLWTGAQWVAFMAAPAVA